MTSRIPTGPTIAAGTRTRIIAFVAGSPCTAGTVEIDSRDLVPCATVPGLKLVIVHSHFRPGGVRRVIELATPHLAATWRPRLGEILLVGGEAPDAAWLRHFRQGVPGRRVACAIDPALGYFSEQRDRAPANVERRIAAHLSRILRGSTVDDCVVWAHNQGLGRNVLVSRALARVCVAQGVTLVFHHHDWWFDNRWARWPEMRRAGVRTLAAAARAVLPMGANIRHAAINRADARILERHLGRQAAWVPNLADAGSTPATAHVCRARRWLSEQLDDGAPVWLMPCRLLRRKNIAEALLLARWLRPEAWLVTTGGVTSADEQPYADALAAAAQHHGWRLRLGMLAGDEWSKPPLVSLVAASEAVLLTSMQEGFGLPYLEAAAAQRPLLARTLPNIVPDLARFGFRFPHAYSELYVDLSLFDAGAERRRQRNRWRAWRQQLPRSCRALAAQPPFLAAGPSPRCVPFSRLTVVAQLEVLARPPAESWAACAALNPFLAAWREQAARRTLAVSRWPRGCARWLSGSAYARALQHLVRATPAPGLDAGASVRAAGEFIRAKLATGNQYPLLWTPEP
ncbi:MAG: glycosyltransferase [Opitutaceae bacterium]|nr:glycosyltransferase [Opitutaceae bacterium]